MEAERSFVADARANETAPKGWPAALLMFHIAQWRGRMRQAFNDVRDGRTQTLPPKNTDEFNDRELPEGAGVSLDVAAGRAASELTSIIDLYEALGERPFAWNVARTTTEAVLRGSYIHPRNHLYAYLVENGLTDRAHRVVEDSVDELRAAAAPPSIVGTAVYNLAVVRVAQGRIDDALSLLEQAIPMRPDLATQATNDADLAPLRGLERFRASAR
jgi:hypothetical protein